jgi:uracil-DNA glycosylase
LNDRSANIVFLLWGRDAQNKGARIDKVILIIISIKIPLLSIQSRHHVLATAHPSPLSAYNGFMGCKVIEPFFFFSVSRISFSAFFKNKCLS